LASAGQALRAAFGSARPFVLTDSQVGELYLGPLMRSLTQAGHQPEVMTVPAGETSKSLECHGRLLARLAELGADRHALVLCLGGGMVSDLGGYVAASYMRGIRYVNLPTSLLAQVDASVGGKVAVNLPAAKNLVGAFHHPSLVLADTDCLRSLGHRDLRSGLAEAIKMGIIDSPAYFEFLERELPSIRAGDPQALAFVAGEGARLKMVRISEDPYEVDLKRPLNFGHTLGHPIETDFAYQGIRHGEAVAIGMGVATLISLDAGWIAAAVAERIFKLLEGYDLLGCGVDPEPSSVLKHLEMVRRIRGGSLNFVLPTGIGAVQIVPDLPTEQIRRGFERYRELVAQRVGSPANGVLH
jgi:3-dehydroquinate synthase